MYRARRCRRGSGGPVSPGFLTGRPISLANQAPIALDGSASAGEAVRARLDSLRDRDHVEIAMAQSKGLRVEVAADLQHRHGDTTTAGGRPFFRTSEIAA